MGAGQIETGESPATPSSPETAELRTLLLELIDASQKFQMTDAMERIESLYTRQREEIDQLTVNFHVTTYANQELERTVERLKADSLTAEEAWYAAKALEEPPASLGPTVAHDVFLRSALVKLRRLSSDSGTEDTKNG